MTTQTHFSPSPQRARGLVSNEVYYSSAQHMTSHRALHNHRHLPRIARKTKRKKKQLRKSEMALLANCPLPWDSGSTHGSLAKSFIPVTHTQMIPAFYPLSAAFYKVIYVIKYYRLLFYHPMIIPSG